MGVSTRRGARTSPPTAAATTTSTDGAIMTTSPPSTTNRTKAPSPKAVHKEIGQIMRRLKETLQEGQGAHGEVYEFYAAAISRLYRRLLELYDIVLAKQGGHVDTPRPNVHQLHSLAYLDTEIFNLYNVLESYMPTKHKKHDAGTKLLGAEVVAAQHRLRHLISERIRLERQEEERRALPAVSQQGLFGHVRGGGNGSSVRSFVGPSTTSASAFDGTFTQGMMAPPPTPMHHQPNLFSPTQMAASCGPRRTYSSTFGSQGTFNTQSDQGAETKINFEELAMRGKHASSGVQATFGASSLSQFPSGFTFSPGSTITSSAATHTPMMEPSFTFRDSSVPPSSSFSFGKTTPASSAGPSEPAGGTSLFIFGAARSSTDASFEVTTPGLATATTTTSTPSVGHTLGEAFARRTQSNTRDAFQQATPLGVATSNLPPSLRFKTPGDNLNGSIHSSRSDQAVGSVASTMSRFSFLSSPAPRRESFSVTPKSSNKRANRSVVRN